MVKSYLRIRPANNYSSNDENAVFYKLNDSEIVCNPPNQSQAFKSSKSSINDIQKKTYVFDKVLDENYSQEEFYSTCVQPLLTEFFNGENVLLFTYGTTSSGKTFTMKGDSLNPGIIPRCINDIFDATDNKIIKNPMYKKIKFNEYDYLNKNELKKECDLKNLILNSVDDKTDYLSNLKSKTQQYYSFSKSNEEVKHIIWVSFLELYNEVLVDLLNTDFSNEKCPPLKIMRDQQNNFFVSGLKNVFVNTAKEAMKVYLYGLENLKKHISSTAMNRNSSRSHSLFTISIISLQKTSTGYSILHVNNLSLSDLAGLERGKKSQTSGLRLKEAGMINKSLFSLKRCLSIIKKKKNNSSSQLIIPFTDSTLTKVFQPFLSGSGMSNIIITINPNGEHFDETVNALEFSALASKIYVFKKEPRDLMKIKIDNLAQLLLDTSRRQSIINNEKTDNLILSNLELFNHNLSSDKDEELIVDSQNVLNDQNFENSYLEGTILFDSNEPDETMDVVECTLFDSKYVRDLNKRIEDLERELRENQESSNLNQVSLSLIEIYQKHEEEKNKVKERMENYMNQRMNILASDYHLQMNDLESENEDLKMQVFCKEKELTSIKEDNEIKNKLIEELTSVKNDFESKNVLLSNEIVELKEIINCKDEEFNVLKVDNEKRINDLLEKSELEKMKIENLEVEIFLKNLINQVSDNFNVEKKEKSFISENKELPLVNISVTDMNSSNQNNAILSSSIMFNDNDHDSLENKTIDQLSIIDFNQSIKKYSSEKRSTTINEHNLENFKKTNLFKINLVDTQNDKNDLKSGNNLKSADLLLLEEISAENKQMKVLLDLKDEEIKKLRNENLMYQKEMKKPIKEEGISFISGSQVEITKNLYTSVLNNPSFLGTTTPYKPLSLLTSNRKKRNLEQDLTNTEVESRYLSFVKNNEKTPCIEKKCKKKKFNLENNSFQVKKEKVIPEEDVDNLMDDLVFIVEETTKKKPSKSKSIKAENIKSVRKRIPLENHRDSFYFENEEEIVPSKVDKRTLRSGRKVNYKQ